MNLRITVVLLLLSVLTVSTLMSYYTPRSRNVEKRIELVIRKIGHELLLQSGDATSRVLPVMKLGEDTWQVEFEREFTFKTDSLVAIANRNLAAAGLEPNHIVEIVDRDTRQMVYGFEVMSAAPFIDACRGRLQPKGNYALRVTFTEPIAEAGNDRVTIIAIMVALAAGFVALYWPKKVDKKKVNDDEGALEKQTAVEPAFAIDPITGFLKFNGEVISLTHKESRLLQVLYAHVNEIVDRDYLLTEVWGKEGVITGRSLDVFISKLRKKFGEESGVKIVNLHGRGYRLEVL
jgi:Transcriptional regulatory protein, C terminal